MATIHSLSYGNSCPIVIVVFTGEILATFIPTMKYPGRLLSLSVSEATKTLFCRAAYFSLPP